MTATRQVLIKKIQELRGSRLLVYVTGDRPPTVNNIGDDAVRPMVEHLRRMGSVEQLDLFIYSRGGAIDVPWRLNSAFRSTAKRWSALVPFRANSAATLLCLGADEIILGHHGELGPIDPIMSRGIPGQTGPMQQQVSVEDIMAFPRFVTERFGLQDAPSQVAALNRLIDCLDAVTLGSAYRTHSHIRYLAEKMLKSRNEPADASVVETIVRTLAEKVYAHGHAVGLGEAQEVGLHAEGASPQLEEAMWALLEAYESDLKLLEPLDPYAVTQTQDIHTEETAIAVIESEGLRHDHTGTLKVEAQRKMPDSLQVQLNMPIQFPPGMDPQDPAIQEMIQQLQNLVPQLAHAEVQKALKAQAPVTGFNLRVENARWRSIDLDQGSS